MIQGSISDGRIGSRRRAAASIKKVASGQPGLLKVSVFGLGYVGSVTSGCLANKGHEVWGVDVDRRKIALINSGKSPLFEPGLEEIISACSRSGLIKATDEVETALLATDASIVCVGTPSRADGSLDLTYVHEVAAAIAAVLRACGKQHKLLLRSTMLPGTTDVLVREYFADMVESGQIEIYYCPEFLREGTAIADFDTPSLEVIGTIDGNWPKSEAIVTLLGSAPEVVEWRAAELVKYACNFFHAVKVSFANEIGRLGDQMSINGCRVMDILCQDTRLNISKYYMRPGNPFGGSCLPKDVKALKSFARTHNISVPILENTFESNRSQQDHLLSKVAATGKRDVTIIGIAFKAGTDDIRESPMIALAETLLGRGYSVKIFDPLMEGEGGRSLERNYPHLANLLEERLEDAIPEGGVVVVFRKVEAVSKLSKLLGADHHIIDVNGWPELQGCKGVYTGLCW